MKHILLSGSLLSLFVGLSHVTTAQQTAADYFESGISKSKAGDSPGALQAFSIAITMTPENAASYYNRDWLKRI